MIYRSKKIDASCVIRFVTSYRVANGDYHKTRNTQYSIRNTNKPAFSLIEAVTALMILAIISSSVVVIIDRCTIAAADSAMRMQAFEVARDNMEALLVKDSVSEVVEYGSSEKYPAIQWQTTVEAFYEPLTNRMWVQALCSAEYADSNGELQTIQLTHWLTDLTKEQLLEMLQQMQQQLDADQIIESIEDAAEYADVDVGTIEQWLNYGMLQTQNGDFIKNELDLYKRTDGQPTPEDKIQTRQTAPNLKRPGEKPGEKPGIQPEGKPPESKPDETTSNNPLGLPDGFPDWTIGEILQWLQDQGKL